MRVVAWTSTVALLVAGGILLIVDLSSYRQNQSADLIAQAGIVARAAAAPLAFEDLGSANRLLAALQERAGLENAALYNSQGHLFTQYVAAGESSAPLKSPSFSAPIIHDSMIEIVRPVSRDGELLGTLYIKVRYHARERVEAVAVTILLVEFLSLGLALLVARRLARSVTAPVEAMVEVARGIVERRDYSLRVRPIRKNDEISLLVQAFNRMLAETQQRTRALEEANVALQLSERRYVALADAMPQLVWVTGSDSVPEYLNEGWTRYTGKAPVIPVPETFWEEVIHPEDRPRAKALWDESEKTGEPYEHEFRIRRHDGDYRWFLTRAVADRGAEGQIVRWFGTCTDIDASKKTEEQLRTTEVALRNADRRKDVFIATLAHELRNPLAPLRVAARLLGHRALTSEQLDSTRAIVSRQVQHMARLLEDLLDVSRITSGQMTLKKDYVSLSDSVQSAVETVHDIIESKAHQLTIDVPSDPLIVEADPDRITQILTNLLANAAKYTDRGGQIVLTARSDANSIVIEVQDSGIGLAPEKLPTIFEMFSRVQVAGTAGESGLGIGLALVKGLVVLHGGTIEARSAGLGQGSTFRVVLPQTAPFLNPVPTSSDEFAQTHITRRILIADDNRDAADSLAMYLRSQGHEVQVAYSGTEVLEAARQSPPEVLLLDIGMPDMTGYDVARRVRERLWGRHATLIAVTGWGQDEDRQQATNAGFDYHLTKPVDPVELLKVMDLPAG